MKNKNEVRRGCVLGPKLPEEARRTYANHDWLKRQLDDGLTVQQIADKTQKSHSCVTVWVARHDLVRRRRNRQYLSPHARRTYANRDWLFKRLKAGERAWKIAREARVCVATIRNWTRRYNLNTGTSTTLKALKTFANRDWLEKQIKAGRVVKEIAAIAGCCVSTIVDRCERFGFSPPKDERPPKYVEERLAIGRWLAPRLAIVKLKRCRIDKVKAYYGIGRPVEKLETIARRYDVEREAIEQSIKRAVARIVDVTSPEEQREFHMLTRKSRLRAKCRCRKASTYGCREWIAERVRRGLSDKKIARETHGVSANTIFRWRRHFGITPPRKIVKTQAKPMIREEHLNQQVA